MAKEHESMDPSCLVSMVQAAGGGVMVWGIFSFTLGPAISNCMKKKKMYSRYSHTSLHSTNDGLRKSMCVYWPLISRFKVQGFFICHMINYTGYNQK